MGCIHLLMMKSNVCMRCYLPPSRDTLSTTSALISKERKKKVYFHSLSWLATAEQNKILRNVTHNPHVFDD